MVMSEGENKRQQCPPNQEQEFTLCEALVFMYYHRAPRRRTVSSPHVGEFWQDVYGSNVEKCSRGEQHRYPGGIHIRQHLLALLQQRILAVSLISLATYKRAFLPIAEESSHQRSS